MMVSALLLALLKCKLGAMSFLASLAVRPVDAEVQAVLRGFADTLAHIAHRPTLNG